GRSPARCRIAGSTLVAIAGTCSTTKTAAGRSPGSLAQIARSASTPPAEAPTTTMSCPVVCWSGGTSLQLPGFDIDDSSVSESSVVVAGLGDSIAEGSPGLRGWDVWVGEGGLQIRKCGIYGQRTGEIAARLEDCARGADVLIVQGGINDIAQGREIETAATNLRAMVRRGKRLGLRALLFDVLPWNNGWPDARPKIRGPHGLVPGVAPGAEG